MSGQHIPQRLDPFKQIGQGTEIAGQIALDKLSRLEGLLANYQGHVALNLQFYRDEQQLAIISGSMTSSLQVPCQRCLQADNLLLASDFDFVLIRDEAEIDNLPEVYEPMLLEKPELDLYELVEEELILALPIVHYHSDGCKDAASRTQFGELDEKAEQKPNPFSVLEKLKSK